MGWIAFPYPPDFVPWPLGRPDRNPVGRGADALPWDAPEGHTLGSAGGSRDCPIWTDGRTAPDLRQVP